MNAFTNRFSGVSVVGLIFRSETTSGRRQPSRSASLAPEGESDDATTAIPGREGWPSLPQWVTVDRRQTVAGTPLFSRQADKLFSEEEKRDLIDYLAENPLPGDEIPGTGGVRKVRFGALGRGKRGGARVVYFYGGQRMPIYALLAYSKSDKTDLSPGERRAVACSATIRMRSQRQSG